LVAVRPKDTDASRAGLRREGPEFAVEAGVAALRWLIDGTGHDITSTDVWAAYAKPGVAC
jgi:hypothetical protein